MDSHGASSRIQAQRRRSQESDVAQGSRRATASDFMDVDPKDSRHQEPDSNHGRPSHGHSGRSRSPRSSHKQRRHREDLSDGSPPRQQHRTRSREQYRDSDTVKLPSGRHYNDRSDRDHHERSWKPRSDDRDKRHAEKHSERTRDGSRSRGHHDSRHERSHRRRRDRDEDSRSPPPSSRRRSRDDNDDQDRRHRRSKRRHESPSPRGSPKAKATMRSQGPLPSQQDAFTGELARQDPSGAVAPPPEKERPNFERSGKLAAETNTVAGTDIVLKYNEPAEARLPPASADWRLFEFKEAETLSTTALSERSCWLFGREQAVADFPILHPSCSSQHAVLQFRHVEKKNEFGDRIGKVRLYLLDLESANGTFLNGERIDDRRYVEVRKGDVIKFGESTREYVLMLA